jgi:tocopherol O-methyltransferase
MIQSLRPISRGDVADHYDDLNAFYLEVWGEHVHHGLWRTGKESSTTAVRQLVEHLITKVGIQDSDEVVDVGCGYGATARLLAQELHATVTGLTISPAQYAFAESIEPGATNPTYLLRDWLDNGLGDEQFDCAIAIESTEHMADKAKVMSELFRVLKPGGTVGIYAWIAREKAKRWEVRHLLEPICREGRLPGMGTEGDYKALLEGAGFVDLQAEELSREVRRTWSHCVGRMMRKIATDTRYRRYLFDARSRNREFLSSLIRIWLAYRLRTMRYLLFTARRPAG